MKPLDLQSEPYHPTGGISAAGVSNQLGRPRIDRLSLLVREAVQNSWDARRPDRAIVQFGIAGWSLTAEQRAWLLSKLLANVPPYFPVTEHLTSEGEVHALAVYDRGTVGLGGPTRADCVVGQGTDANFVNLLRNVGHPPTRLLSGGTYGFGKTALFVASQMGTIVVHTRTVVGGSAESRFMGAALGEEYTAGGSAGLRRHTGRHWWGRRQRDDIVDPLTRRDADAAADALGLPTFEGAETGTTILILHPDFEGREPSAAMRLMSVAILRYFWPKMLDGSEGVGSMEFEVTWNNARISLPRPDQYPPLHAFARAFKALRAQQANAVADPAVRTQPVACNRPQQHLGNLSLLRFPPTPRVQGAETSGESHGPFSGTSRHVALMRAPNFVVKYLEGPPVPFDAGEYAGVFLADNAVDSAFASAEPPTHDDWSPDILRDRTAKTFVNVALRRIKEALRDFASPPSHSWGSSVAVPLGAFSDQLGGLFAAEVGSGARSGTESGAVAAGAEASSSTGGAGARGGRGSSGAMPGRVTVPGPGRIDLVSGVPAVVVDFDVETNAKQEVVVAVAPNVVLEGGSLETEPPAGAQLPRVLQWRGPSGVLIEDSERIKIPPDLAGRWSVAVSSPRDSLLAVELTIERVMNP